jgi:putative NADH-flavin reductase
MKILITGANGFIGRNLATSLELEHEVTKLTRQTVDLTDKTAVDEYFKDKKFDVILHCAMVGGRRSIKDGPEVLWANLAMFYNLISNQHKFGKLINFGSGAELDRSNSINLIDPLYKDKYPLDYYGMAKNIICRLIENEDNMTIVRSFFSPHINFDLNCFNDLQQLRVFSRNKNLFSFCLLNKYLAHFLKISIRLKFYLKTTIFQTGNPEITIIY